MRAVIQWLRVRVRRVRTWWSWRVHRARIRVLSARCREIRDVAKAAQRSGLLDDAWINHSYEPRAAVIVSHVVAAARSSGSPAEVREQLATLARMLDELEDCTANRVAARCEARRKS